jgi:signal transduction histidine kinase
VPENDGRPEPLRSMLYVPLCLKGAVIGVLCVKSFKDCAYDASHIDILQTLAAYAATAIDNARVHEQLGLQATALLATNEKLVALDGFKQGMMGMIVHDLKNPLNVILSTLDSPSLLSRLVLLRQSARQMLTLVLNILDVQKFEDAAMVVDKADVGLAVLATHAVEQVRFLVERKNITLDFQLPLGLTVQCDAEMIERVLVNLLTNAVKYTPQNGLIVLGAERDAEHVVRVFVKDSGEGIPPDRLDSVFQKFSQHKARNSGEVRSTGLGLNFCKLAVQAHDGRIGVLSLIGAGSTFWFTLAAAQNVTVLGLGADASVSALSASTTTLNLSGADRAMLEPVVCALRSLAIYRYTDLCSALKPPGFPSNERIDAWRRHVQAAIETENEQLLDALLKL